MKRTAAYIIFSIMSLLGSMSRADLLLWMIDEPEIQDTDGMIVEADNLVGRGGEAEGKTINGARISATDGSGNTVYLMISDSWGNSADPIALPDSWGDYSAGPFYSSFSTDSPEYYFTIELGYATMSEDQVNKWIVLATASETYQNLVKSGYIAINETSIQGGMFWSPNFTVPEPSSLILCLIGISTILLRRKRRSHSDATE